jgi:hypothetical protein
MSIRATTVFIALGSIAFAAVPSAAARSPAKAASAASAESQTDTPSEGVAELTSWVVGSRDNGKLPFMVIDKVGARLFVFDAAGQQLGTAPVLIGITKGDESAPGVGDRELSNIPVEQRTTPAGRFLAKFGPAVGQHKRVLWVDYGDAISLHPVISANKKERRLQRLLSFTPDDNRITFGCINAPTSFYNKFVKPLFSEAGGVVYILPDSRPLIDVFPGIQLAGQPSGAPLGGDVADSR